MQDKELPQEQELTQNEKEIQPHRQTTLTTVGKEPKDTPKRSCIVITNDFQREICFLKNTHDHENLKIFEFDELKIDHAHTIIREAHIITQAEKTLAIFAFSYNHFAQNALLKILEEPPKNIIFMIHINARNKLIPTIFSRLFVINRYKKQYHKSLDLDLKRLNVPMVYDYIKNLEKENMTNEQGRILLAQILEKIAHENIPVSKQILERFDIALHALHTKQSVHFAILPILLSLTKR